MTIQNSGLLFWTTLPINRIQSTLRMCIWW